jgi:hypothetical protein
MLSASRALWAGLSCHRSGHGSCAWASLSRPLRAGRVGVKLCKLRYAGSALGPCHNGRARVCAGTNGRPQLRGTAGRGPSAQAAGITQTGDSDCGLEGQVGDAGAADGQQPESVTTGEPARRPVRIMTAKPAIAPIHVDGSTCVPGRSTRWMLFPVCERQGVEADRERGR